MGWKSATIIVNTDSQLEVESVLERLGFSNLELIGSEPFESAIYPTRDDIVYCGRYKNNLIICHNEIPFTFLNPEVLDEELILNNLFPNIEICAILLQSVVNLWGYSLSKNGQKIRVRGGSSDSGTMVDFGDPLKEETELLSHSTVNETGERVYKLPEFPEELFTEDQVGESFVFKIAERYFGKPLDQADELLFESQFSCYSYKN